MRLIYLDHAATSPLDEGLHGALAASHAELGFNPSSAHAGGKRARAALHEARRAIARLVGGEADGLCFTHGATEAANILVQGLARQRAEDSPDRREILVSAIEHPAVFETARSLQAEGWTVRIIPVDGQGLVTVPAIEALLSPRTALVCVMAVNNETGAIQQVNALAQAVKARDPSVFFLTDFVQAAGKLPIALDLDAIDAFFLSGHKIGAPKGTGAFYLHPDRPIRPILFGGGQENGYRPGTTDPVGARLLSLALAEAMAQLPVRLQRVSALNDALLGGLAAAGVRAVRTVAADKASPYILSLAFPGHRAGALVEAFSAEGVCIAAGSACSSGSSLRSRVLEAMRLPPAQIDATVRISFSWRTTAEEIDALVRIARGLLTPAGAAAPRMASP